MGNLFALNFLGAINHYYGAIFFTDADQMFAVIVFEAIF
jgi:hypothetical protein